MSTRDRSPRPAETLPPTLLPNAVALAAPGADRALSLGAALLVYAILGAAMYGSARRVVRAVAPSTASVTWELPETGPEIALPRLPPPAPIPAGVRPSCMTVLPPAPSIDAMPDDVPRTFGPDRSHEMMGGPEGPAVPGPIQGIADPGAPPAPVQVARPSGPVEVEVRQLRVLEQVTPAYPALARLVKAQGPVVLQMTIDERGIPTQVTVVSGPHPLLVEEAVRAARLWRFQPMTLDGVPVPATFRLTVGFRLGK